MLVPKGSHFGRAAVQGLSLGVSRHHGCAAMKVSPDPVYSLTLDFPIRPRPRYGWGRPAHPQLRRLLDQGRRRYRETLSAFLQYAELYRRIPKQSSGDEATDPFWINGSLPGLDAVALYGFIAQKAPRRYFEIGVGNSTRFARRAIADHGLSTRVIAVDIGPPPGVESLCDELLVSPLEDLDPGVFDCLEAGDILFVDNSHRVFMNSDATVVFLDILPRLKPGVMVQIHDIALPYDYPPEWIGKYYSEQYVLAACLLAGSSRYEVLLPNAFVSMEPELSAVLAPLWSTRELNADQLSLDLSPEAVRSASQLQKPGLVETHGSSFWMMIRD